MQRATFFLLIMAAVFAPPAWSQVARDVAERRADRRQLATDAAQLAGDMGDVRRLERLVGELDAARSSGNKAAESAVQARIAAELRRETREGARDARQDRAERLGAAAEKASDRREIRRDRADRAVATSPAEGRDDRRDIRRDRRDLRDDRRDARDDARDAAASAVRAQRQRQILTELRQIQPGVSDGAARQRALLDEFLQISREDARATGRELGEDRRELREDRRETRDDIRERREP
jgi:hypothetical protein